MPAKRVARLGDAICGLCLCGYLGGRLLRQVLFLASVEFDCAARRCARFGLVSCIVFPFNVGGIASDRAALCGPTSSDT